LKKTKQTKNFYFPFSPLLFYLFSFSKRIFGRISYWARLVDVVLALSAVYAKTISHSFI